MDVETLSDSLTSRVDDANERLGPVVDRLRDDATAQWHDLRDRTAETVATERIARPRWSTRLLWMGLGALAGALATWFADPDRGRARRQHAADSVGATSRQVADDIAQKTDYVAGEAKGAVVEGVKSATPEDVPTDPKLLRQRIRSEVFGQRDDVEDVVVRVDGPGQVALKGTVPTPEAERSLVAEVSRIEGVTDVQSELGHAAG